MSLETPSETLPIQTSKIITPSPPTETNGSKFTDSRVREAPNTVQHSYLPPQENDLLAGYQGSQGSPYLAEVMDVQYLYRDLSTEIDRVHQYITDELERLDLSKTKSAYRAVYQSVTKELKVHKFADPISTLKKMSVFLEKVVLENAGRKQRGDALLSLSEIYSKN